MAEPAPTPAPVPAGLPSPRSPTLSCAEMILPESSLRSFSPSPYVERPPSPPTLRYSHSNQSVTSVKLVSAPQGRRGPSTQVKSSPLSTRSSRSTLRTMVDSDGGAPRIPPRDEALASSPTIAAPLSSHPTNGWTSYQERRASNASSSIHSEDLEKMRWPAFDGPGAFDDSGVVLEEDDEDEEQHDQFPEATSPEEDVDNDQWLDEQSEVDDEASSAALSRRAEMILANAKKRLNVMEGNLRGARQSLVVSPPLNNIRMGSELSSQLAVARERDRRLYAGIGPIPPRTRHYHSSPLSPNNSPGHSRGMSETSVPIPFSTYTSMHASKRASSAMGQASGPWSPEGYGQGRFPIRESRSFEVMREPPRNHGWAKHEEREPSLRSYDSRDSNSPPHTALETLPEDEDGPTLRRSVSTATDLRSQMDSLKGRISSLKQRAQEDNMRRRSMQSLRTSSPFTNAETWYTGVDAYKTERSPVTADAGVGIKIESPVRKTLFEKEETNEPTRRHTTSGMSPRQVEPLSKARDAYEKPEHCNTCDSLTNQYRAIPDPHLVEKPAHIEGADSVDLEDNEFVSVNGDDIEPAGESVYEDAVYEMPVTERHEDRVDAFDYEHFFLHSAMGTYSSASRRSSSSEDSVATTRPATAIFSGDELGSSTKRMSMHQRNSSVDSVSTMASFATAAEEQSDDEEENEQMDQFSQQILPNQQQVTQRYTMQNGVVSPRSDSAINMRKGNASPGQTSQASRTSSPGGDHLKTGLHTSRIYSILLETPSQKETRLALSEQETQLIYSLAASFQQVCANLQSTAGDQYERKEWRRRLDEARRVLNGEETEGQPF